ncbi:MAG: hypothetical protein VSS52_010400 [Thiotrichaceae bacterium]|nr:hypothetical protein [Thiotrichaceae bacterium]
METLHEYLTNYISTLQTILDKHQDKEAIIEALMDSYPEQDDIRKEWILDALREGNFKKNIKNSVLPTEDTNPDDTPTNRPVFKNPSEPSE